MANSAVPAPAQVHARPLFDVFRPTARRLFETPAPSQHDSAWDMLSLVLNQQLSQDALLLWRYERSRERLLLLASSPSSPYQSEVTLRCDEQLALLAAGRLEALAHVHCALSDSPLEQTLWDLGLHAGLTAVLAEEEGDVYFMTFGFRERWQLVAHHTSTIVAVATYLREVQRLVMPSPLARPWWEMLSLVPHLWRQPYRPSVMRTMYDLNEMLSDVAERVGVAADPALAPERRFPSISRLAHKGADLIARLESVYWDPRPTVATEEYLSEALLLVRGAYQLCLGDWPGCMAAGSSCPATDAGGPNAIRHALIDWVLEHLSNGQTLN